jgi:hypothetical protein
MRRVSVIMLTLLLSVFGGESAVSDSTGHGGSRHPYISRWKHATFGKGAVARVTAGAGINQLRGYPHNYGGGVSGFGKRVGAGLASNAVGRTVEHALAARLHEDLDYHPSGKHGVGPRLGYALESTVVTHNTRTGKQVPAMGRIAGHAASGAFAQGVLMAGSGAATAGVGLGVDAGANVAREFMPHKRRTVAHR